TFRGPRHPRPITYARARSDRVDGVSEIAGLSGVVVVTQDGRPVTMRTGGGCTSTTCFQIASVSKNFAATLVLMLAEGGRLDLRRSAFVCPSRRRRGPT